MIAPDPGSSLMVRRNARYRIDFALLILLGNITRYKITRPLVEQDPEIETRWYPIRTHYAEDPLRFLPTAVRVRVRHLLDSWPLFARQPADAVLLHTFETYYLYALLHRLLRLKTVLVNNPDGVLPSGRSFLSRWLYQTAIRQTTLYMPWSQWAREETERNYPELRYMNVEVLHPGIDLNEWPLRPARMPEERFRLLFVGGDLLRKGADVLLDAFERRLDTTCDLHIATQSSSLSAEMRATIQRLPNVTLHLDLTSGSPPLKALYRSCDAFVLPTNQDHSSWVAIEALATGLPVIITPTGGIPDIIMHEETGLLIPPADPAALAAAVERLRTEPELRERLIRQGRRHVEAHFNAEKNTARLLCLIKSLVDERRRALRPVNY